MYIIIEFVEQIKSVEPIEPTWIGLFLETDPELFTIKILISQDIIGEKLSWSRSRDMISNL